MNNNEILKKIEELKSEITRLEEVAKKQEEPKFKRKSFGEEYYTIGVDSSMANMCRATETLAIHDTMCFNNNNYFYTFERAEEVVDKIKFLLNLERLHDTYCPDYKPDWDNEDKTKFSIHFDHYDNKYCCSHAYSVEDMPRVYFPTEEIAQKVCDILNEKLANKR